MRKKYESKTSLFLIELIIVILFFSITSAICIQIFVKSHTLSNKSINSNHAQLLIQNVTEVFYSENGYFPSLKDYFSTTDTNHFTTVIPEFISSYDDAFTLLFDANWNPVTNNQDYKYTLLALYSEDMSFHTLDICIYECPDSPINFFTYQDFINDLDKQHIWNYHIQIIKYKQKGVL